MPAEAPTDRWILLRGLARESGHWLDFPSVMAPQLGACFPLDLPGTGQLHKLQSPARMREITEFVRAQKAFLPQGEYFAVGVSLGGMVLSDWVSRYPSELKGIVLINSSRGDLSPPYKRMIPQAGARLLRARLSASLYERELKILSVISQRQERHKEWAEQWAEIARQRPISAATISRQLFAATTLSLSRKVSDVPALVLSSLGDQLVDPSCSTRMAEAWDCEIQRHPWGGHELQLDDPEWVVEKIKAWRGAL